MSREAQLVWGQEGLLYSLGRKEGRVDDPPNS